MSVGGFFFRIRITSPTLQSAGTQQESNTLLNISISFNLPERGNSLIMAFVIQSVPSALEIFRSEMLHSSS